jgi:hypothetical protein
MKFFIREMLETSLLKHKDLVFVVIILFTIVIVPSTSAATYEQQPRTLQDLSTSSNQTTITPFGLDIPTTQPSDIKQSPRLISPQGASTTPTMPTTTVEPSYLKVITTVKNNNATSPYWDQITARDVLIQIRGMFPFNNDIIQLMSFPGLEKGWNFTFPRGTQYDVYVDQVSTRSPHNVHHSNDCQGILNAGQSKTCFITVTLVTLPPQSSVTPLPSNQTVSPGSANATAGLTNSTR